MTVDGPSGVGKTTVSRLMGLRLRAQGLRVLVTTTPSGSTLGNLARGQTYELRGMALSCLVAADRYHHDRQVVRPALADGTIVVCDRYVPSSLVLDVLDGVEPAVIQILYSDITVPDLAIVLTGDPVVCAERAKRRGTYSRFHATSADHARQEAQLFDMAISRLRDAQYRVHEHAIGQIPADGVADALTSVILNAKDRRP
ncbi:MAG: dTMP kinase [Pseudonocardiaceae bacterium]